MYTRDPYDKTIWVYVPNPLDPPPDAERTSPENLNKIEDGIYSTRESLHEVAVNLLSDEFTPATPFDVFPLSSFSSMSVSAAVWGEDGDVCQFSKGNVLSTRQLFFPVSGGFKFRSALESSRPFWSANTNYSQGDQVSPTEFTGLYYECTQAGTSGPSEPTWTDSLTDGTVEWTLSGEFWGEWETILSDKSGSGGSSSPSSDASSSVKGVSRLSVAPASATDPVAVGDNDSRLLGAVQATSLASDSGASLVHFKTATGVNRDLGTWLGEHVSVKDFGAVGSGTSTTGSISSGSNSLTVASAASFSIANGIKVAGAGAPPLAERESLSLSAGAITTGSVTVTLDGVATNVAVAGGDTSAGVSAKIAATVFTGWTAAASGSVVTFTSNATGSKAAPAYSDGGTGAAGTMTTTTRGQNQRDLVSVITAVSGTTLTLRDAAGTTVTNTSVTHDDSPAFQAALNYLVSVGGGSLYVPRGNYPVASLTSISTTKTTISIVGDGIGVSTITVDNTGGFLSLAFTSNGSQLTIEGLTLYANLANSGKGFSITAPGGGNFHNRSLIVRDVECRPVDITSHYFDYGFYTTGQWRPLFDNVSVGGPFGPNTNPLSITDPIYSATCCFHLYHAYDPVFTNCYAWSAKTGYRLTDDASPGPEAGRFTSCIAVNCLTGMDVSTVSHEPLVFVDGCHISCLQNGLKVSSRRLIRIMGCLFYGQVWPAGSTPLPYVDINLTDTWNTIISNNQFHQPTNSGRINIAIQNPASKPAMDTVISGNWSDSSGTFVRTASGTSGTVVRNNKVITNTDPSTGIGTLLEDHATDTVLDTASSTARGYVRLTANPAVSSDPVAVGANDPAWASHISGLNVDYTSANSVTVGTGSVWIPSLQRVVDVPAPITLSNMTMTANAWYYLYLFVDGNDNPQLSYSNVAPTGVGDTRYSNPSNYPLRGTAKVRSTNTSPDFSRRYIGEVLCSPTANSMYRFMRHGSLVRWLENVQTSPFRVLSGGTSSTATTVNCSGAVPVTGLSAITRLQHNGTASILSISNSTSGASFAEANAGNSFVVPNLPLDGSQAFTYAFGATPGGSGATMDIHGYQADR